MYHKLCHLYFSRLPREAHVAIVPPDRKGDGGLGRLGHVADGRLAQDWNLVCLTPRSKLRDPKHGWTMHELTCDLSKSATISATSCDPKGS